MKKIFLQLNIYCFICSTFVVSSVLAGDINTKIEQVYLHNEYIINELETLLRSEEKKPRRIGAQLKTVDMSLLLIKINSLNFLMSREVNPDELVTYIPLNKQLDLNNQTLLQQSFDMLKLLPDFFMQYKQAPQAGFDKAVYLNWYTPEVTNQTIHQQFLQIERLLFGLKNMIEPKDVYEVVQATHALIVGNCAVQNKPESTKLVMGKRPKDVYVHLYKYLDSLSRYKTFDYPERGPIHILPHDVFGIAIVALVYSQELVEEKNNFLRNDGAHSMNQYDVVTPSHVFQIIDENIKNLECMTHVSR